MTHGLEEACVYKMIFRIENLVARCFICIRLRCLVLHACTHFEGLILFRATSFPCVQRKTMSHLHSSHFRSLGVMGGVIFFRMLQSMP